MRIAMAAAVVTAALGLGLGTAAAGNGWGHDRVYADSYGNLVIESAAGYKRILVGEGHQAKELAAYTRAGQPDVTVVEGVDGEVVTTDCYKPPRLVKGRDYMYGFDQGEIPWQGGPCR